MNLPARSSGVEPGVAGNAALDHFPQRRRELPVPGADERESDCSSTSFLAEPRSWETGVVGLQDLALEVGDEDGSGAFLIKLSA